MLYRMNLLQQHVTREEKSLAALLQLSTFVQHPCSHLESNSCATTEISHPAQPWLVAVYLWEVAKAGILSSCDLRRTRQRVSEIFRSQGRLERGETDNR